MGLVGAGSEKLCEHGYRRDTCDKCSYNWLNDQLHDKDAEIARLKAEVEKQQECQSCGEPLSRDCPRCKRLWES